MLLALLIAGLLGILTYLLGDILDFNKRTKVLDTWGETLPAYFKAGNTIKLSLGTIVTLAFCLLQTVPGGDFIVQWITNGALTADSVGKMCFVVYFVALSFQAMLDKIMNIGKKNPEQIQLKQ